MTGSGGWNPSELPAQRGKTIVVTGANAGLGFWASEQLARAGAHVVLACRDEGRADAALRAIRARVSGASVSTLALDVASLDSVAAASARLLELERIDGLVLNAGIVHPPRTRQLSADGLELVVATNYLGHFALTARLLPALQRTPGARVVALGSMISRLMDSSLEDLQLAGGYNSWRAYAQSKIAMQVFGFELDRRLAAAARAAGIGDGARASALVAHPGYSIGGRTPRVPGVNEPSALKRFVDNLQAPITQGKNRGAWPIVRAIADPDARGGQYWGPRFVTKGEPTLQQPTATSTDRAVAERVWRESEQLTGVDFALEGGRP
ncbi:SDR family NAD(P)-dependent oxidoreductase [Microterricola viridarii]|uniref:Short chain dehydrogenase n=1 Tax=Microterricola viridarii TaxID=412690 RepID=A0A1H1NL54_9MICO|nr:SDR family NAD(P)-dependent oxidoreductase [Microterricola viridarii]SDR99734.1 short chain dehydrogenase [Microterricola viridarii]